MEETITYELIRKIQMEEQRQPKLVKLPENFFKAAANYLQQKKLLEKDEKRTVIEIKNVKRLLEDIVNRRERKIINFAILASKAKIEPENMTEEEKKFFEDLTKLIAARRDSLMKEILEDEKKFPLVVFKEETPEFIGIDGKVYGPFKKGDIARIPEENIKTLVEKNIVEEFKVSE